MTTIAAFSSLNFEDKSKEQKRPSNVYFLSDSQISYINVKDGSINSKESKQKLFYSDKAKLIFCYAGDAKLGYDIARELNDKIAIDSEVRLAKSIDEKIDSVKGYFDQLLEQNGKDHKLDLYFFLTLALNGEYRFVKLVAKKGSKMFSIIPVKPENELLITTMGSGESKFKAILRTYLSKYCKEKKSAVFFNSFFEFLENNEDQYSSLPMQGLVMDKNGNIKVISIKHEDEFYALGNQHKNRANFNYEIDYRDKQFEFLHSDGKIRGKNRKRHHFIDCEEESQSKSV